MRSPSLRERLAAAPARFGIAAVDRAAHVFARIRYSMPDAHPARHNLVVHRDIAYASSGQAHHRLDVYVPTRPARPLPVVMYVHGGGFTMLSKETHRVMALAIARAGYLLFNINYRLGPRNTYPAPLEDACAALLWVRKNAERFGGDPSRIALAGESAGGNLVTALAVASSWRRPEPFARRVFDGDVRLAGVVATYGFLDLGYTDYYASKPNVPRWVTAMLLDAARSYVGYDVRAAVEAYPLASPLRIIEAGTPDRPLPPFFLSVGTRDPLIRCSKRLKTALDGLGTPCELHVSPGEIHGYDAMVWRAPAKEKWRAAHAFLDKHVARRSESSVDVAAAAGGDGDDDDEALEAV
jgi:acetyl esterase